MRYLLVFLSANILLGCSAVVPEYAYVDSVASSSAADLTRYVLFSRPGRYQDTTGSLPGYVRKRHEGFVALTHDVLGSAGFRRVESQEEAELVVVLDYGVEVEAGPARTERTSFVELAGFDRTAVLEEDHRNAVWRTRAYKDGSAGGLSRVVPALIEALRPFVATRTDGAMEVPID